MVKGEHKIEIKCLWHTSLSLLNHVICHKADQNGMKNKKITDIYIQIVVNGKRWRADILNGITNLSSTVKPVLILSWSILQYF